jgi:Matrixin
MLPIIAFAALAGTARPVHAFCRTTVCSKDCPVDPVTSCPTGIPIGWPQLCVSYSMQRDASETIDLETATTVAEKAFDVWQTAPCPLGGSPSIRADHKFGTVACKVHEYNQVDGNANIIMFHDTDWPYGAAGGSVLALTTVTFSKKTGDIYDVDMEINAQQALSTNEIVDPNGYDLQSIITHEAGHFMGLAHSFDPDATMWAHYSAGTESFRDLSDDDIAGICTVYPPTTALNVCDFAPRQGFSPECGLWPAGTGGCVLAAGPKGKSKGRDSDAAMLAVATFAAVAARRKRNKRR